MPKVKLSAKVVENATAPAPGVQIDLFDATLPAFGLRVGGRRKTWFIIYRFAGKQKRHTLGHFPGLSLADARKAAGDALEDIEKGIDPAAVRVEEKAEIVARAETVEDAVDDYMSRYAAKHQKRPDQTRWFFDHYVLPKWRKRAIADIRKRDVLDLLDDLVDQGKGAAANRVLDVLRKLFNWRVERSDDDDIRNPCAGVKQPVPPKTRTVTLDTDHIKALWTVADGAGYPWGPLVKTLLLTGQRRTEVAAMRWADVDLDGAIWRLSPDQTKSSRAHLVPLSPAVVEILRQVPRFVGGEDNEKEKKRTEYVFTTLGDRPVSGFSKAKARLDKTAAEQRAKEEAEPLPGWRLHDIRRTVVTGLSALGVPEIVKQRVVNHAPRGVTQRHYDQYEYLDEKRDALERWATKVQNIVTSTPDNVTQTRPEEVTN